MAEVVFGPSSARHGGRVKRDMELIRKLLIKLETLPVRPGAVHFYAFDGPELAVEGHSSDQVQYHLDLLKEAGLIDVGGRGSLESFMFRKLTWTGHDFLDSVRDDKIWAMTKRGAEAAGGFTMALLAELAKGLVKKQIEQHTGVKL